MHRIRALLERTLGDAGLLLEPAELGRIHASIRATAAELLPGLPLPGGPAAFGAALGLEPDVMQRVLGFGGVQARAISETLGLGLAERAQAVELGALFNLGIALFDHVCDEHEASARNLIAAVTPATLQSLMRGVPQLERTGDPRVDPLLHIVRTVFVRCRRHGVGLVYDAICSAMERMYAAELRARVASRTGGPPSDAMLADLGDKSVLPLWTVALCCLLVGRLTPSPEELEALRRGFWAAGSLLWLIDDLCDLREDWAAGRWSRPWILWARDVGAAPPLELSESDALDAINASDVPAREARLLVSELQTVRSTVPGAQVGSELDRCLRGTLQAWTQALPIGPQVG